VGIINKNFLAQEAIKTFGQACFLWVGRETANKHIFDSGLKDDFSMKNKLHEKLTMSIIEYL
jgi:hypothetical protein